MAEVSFRITIDDDTKIKEAFSKVEVYIVKEQENGKETHYHGVVYDKKRETVRNIITKNFATPTLKGNKLYSMNNVDAKGGNVEKAERYLSKGRSKGEAPTVIVNSRGVDVDGRHAEYWREYSESSANVGRRKKELRSFKKGFKEYFADIVSDNDFDKRSISLEYICMELLEYGKRVYDYNKEDYPYNSKSMVMSIYQVYSQEPERQKVRNFMKFIGLHEMSVNHQLEWVP